MTLTSLIDTLNDFDPRQYPEEDLVRLLGAAVLVQGRIKEEFKERWER